MVSSLSASVTKKPAHTSVRIVRDYEKYLARQFRRGTPRQELNVSWLKKNEMDLKRHVQDLRENIHLGVGGNSSLSVNDIPRSPGAAGTNKEFVTGYALGLVGGVRSWVSSAELAGCP